MKKRKNRVTAKLVIAPNEILTKVCEPVKDGEDVSGIIRDMMHILVDSKTGVGLAAPQAGHLKRIKELRK
jgi:peptide deformylase